MAAAVLCVWSALLMSTVLWTACLQAQEAVQGRGTTGRLSCKVCCKHGGVDSQLPPHALLSWMQCVNQELFGGLGPCQHLLAVYYVKLSGSFIDGFP